MAPGFEPNHAPPADVRVALYRAAKVAVIVLVCAAAVKFLALDTVVVRTDQMGPTLLQGDRALVFRLSSVWPLSEWFVPGRKSPIVFDNPAAEGKPSCLRVAAVSGDSIAISHGSLLILDKNESAVGARVLGEDILPPEYSPRDSASPYRLPGKGTRVALDSLPLRDFFFAASLIRQEHPRERVRIVPSLFINGSPADSMRTTDFYLYKGRIDSVPAQFEFDWFFWDRLRDYLIHSQQGKEVLLAFSLLKSETAMDRYTFTKSCIFLLADDWQKGFDSRYFGPVVASCVKGRIVGVLWSVGGGGSGIPRPRIGRLFKIIR